MMLINDVDADIDEDDQWVAYSVQRADPLCYKFDNLIRRGLVDKNGNFISTSRTLLKYSMIDAINTIAMSLNFLTVFAT